MIYRNVYEGGTWIDLEGASEEELTNVVSELALSDRVEQELMAPTPVALVASDDGATFMVIHFPLYGEGDGELRDQEIDVVVGKGFILTAHYEVVETLELLHKSLETRELISPKDQLSAEEMLDTFFAHLYSSIRDRVSHAAGRLSKIEKDMFGGKERQTVRPVSNINREFLRLETSLAAQEAPLEKFFATLHEHKTWHAFKVRAERLLAERAQIARLVGTYRAVAAELRETNGAILEASQNEIIKTLTTITIIVLPIELTAFVFSIHVPGTPLETHPYAFWILTSAMLIMSSSLTFYFARKKWLF